MMLVETGHKRRAITYYIDKIDIFPKVIHILIFSVQWVAIQLNLPLDLPLMLS